MKKKCAYVLAVSQNIVFAAGNVALELNKYMPNEEFDIIIYHNGLQENDVIALNKIPNVHLEEICFPQGFEEYMLKNLPQGRWNNKNSLLMFSHYQIFNLLDKYSTAIWLDVDISIQASITELSSYGPLGMSFDYNYQSIFSVQQNFLKPILGYDMNAQGRISAVLVATDKLKNAKEIYNWCFDKSKEYAQYLYNPDQGIINLAIQQFKIPVKNIPFNIFVDFATMEDAHIAKIAHFGTEKKVWNNNELYQSFPQWHRTHLEYVSLGGSDITKELNNTNVYVTLEKLIQQNNAYKNILQKNGISENINKIKLKYYFLGIKVIEIQKSFKMIKFKLLSITFYKKKWKNNKVKYYICGIPMVKYVY